MAIRKLKQGAREVQPRQPVKPRGQRQAANLKRSQLRQSARQSARDRVAQQKTTVTQKKGMGHKKPGSAILPDKSNPNPLLRKRMQASAAKRKAAGKAPASQASIDALRKRASARMAAKRPSSSAPHNKIVGGDSSTWAPKKTVRAPLVKKNSVLNPKRGNAGGGGYNRFSNRSKTARPFDKYNKKRR